ncbi:unnamed protein product [Euphydryas editha]|uniref:Uncharacterized protein n=1 Tax=Euphydryas editha TaxID=104508 RepID=A0AAU9UBZ7_EUPED|nr:unnamed protein product [Euphydryas editha]
MDFLEETLDICNSSSNMLEDITVQQVLDVVQPGCQKESEKRVLEKRGRENDSLEDEEGFVTVQKAAKRIARSNSISNNRENVEYRITITSKEILPKQFGMAKLLRSENINANKNKQNHIQEEVIEDQRINFQQSNTLTIQRDGRSYRDVVVETDVHQNMSTEEDEEEHVRQCWESQTNRTMIKSGKKKKAIKKGKD